MSDALNLTPLFAETLARVRVRMDADANAGLDISDAAFIDTREGSFYWDMTQVAALEIARLWDALGSETVAAAFPSLAWGEYLDEHAATFGLLRNPAQPATGTVQFNGTAGTLVASNDRVSADPSDPSQDAITFQVTASGTTCAAVPAPSGITATPNTAGGTLPVASYIYHVTSYNAFGESLGSADVLGNVVATGHVVLAWSAAASATGYLIYRTLTVGGQGGLIGSTMATTFTDTGAVAPGTLEPTQDTTSGVLLPVTALVVGSEGNVAVDAITSLDTVVPGINAISNATAMTGGTDVEDDSALRLRVLAQYSGASAGTVSWYEQQVLRITGVERAVCVPVWSGPGTVLVIAMLADGSPVSNAIVTSAQQLIDPTPGLGHGIAPIGATVTVVTTVALSTLISATVVFQPGYSLDGAAGTIATRSEIVSALAAYTSALNPGDTLGYQQIQAAFFTVDGVIQVNGLTVNGGTADIVLTTSPAQYALLATPTLV